jgi:hypothetical protein
MLVLTALLPGIALAQRVHRRWQPQQPDFCQSDACACPWAGKGFTVPAAGGLGPFDDGEYLPYPRQYVAYRTDTPPVLDGDLSDPAWEEAQVTQTRSETRLWDSSQFTTKARSGTL